MAAIVSVLHFHDGRWPEGSGETAEAISNAPGESGCSIALSARKVLDLARLEETKLLPKRPGILAI